MSILEKEGIKYNVSKIKSSESGQSHESYFIWNLFLKIYSDESSSSKILDITNNYSPKIVSYGTYESKNYAIFEKIIWKTISQVLYKYNKLEQQIILKQIVLLLREIHESLWISHWDFHIWNIMIPKNKNIFDYKNYIVLDRDESSKNINDDILWLIEFIANTAWIVSENLEKYYKNNLYDMWILLNIFYKDFCLDKNLWIKATENRIEKKYNYLKNHKDDKKVLNMYNNLKNFRDFLLEF